MKPNQILILLLGYMVALSGLASYLDAHRIAEPPWLMMTTSIAGSLLVFWWYWADSTSISYRRSPLLNVSMVAVGVLASPYYLVRSRQKGKRLLALAKWVGFVLLMVVATVIGALVATLVS